MGKNTQRRRLHLVEPTGGTMEVQMPEKAREKLFAAFQQRESINQQFDAALQLTFDAMGIEGKVVGVKLDTGVITVDENAEEGVPELAQPTEGA